MIASTRTTWTVDGKPNERIGFLPMYVPGTPNAAEALRIKVGIGQDVNIGDFPLAPGRVATISGTALRANGLPLAGESVERSQIFEGPGTMMSFGVSGAKVNADGSFLIKDVAPGDTACRFARLSRKKAPSKEPPPRSRFWVKTSPA